MSKADRREILSRVAAGTITPEEAASQLDAINADERQAESSIRTVRVVRQLGSFEIVGDPSVRDAVAEGPHHARIDQILTNRQSRVTAALRTQSTEV